MERSPDNFLRLLTYIAIGLAVVFMYVGFSSCNPAHRATSKFYRAVKLDRTTTGKNCYDVYPTKDSIQIQTEYKQGETIRDTFTNIQVEVMNDTVYIYSTQVINNHTRDTAYLRITTTKENTAKADYYRDGWDKEKIAHAESDQRGDIWMWIALSAIWVLVVLGVYKIWKLYRKTMPV